MVSIARRQIMEAESLADVPAKVARNGPLR
jgi:hypothetical protein